ncbi:SAM-dependent methyltransferase [Vibrio sp. Isolate22]|uniref:CheR family methyltransferase n=1 Tax=Vibrio TaxID=662 RepID=UPI001EFE7BE0|nr:MULTISPECIES: CheR family methyltransferase [Vibrio]MCG9673907.1 SAM-dependent methyltransferase [Vibrio chagasii]MCG9693796.1 SAM-dependent methyltransferase [Vibrio sp. Isolate22]
MVTDNFFYNAELYRDYSELVIERQLRGSDLLICCLDTGQYYDSFSLAMLHSYYEQKTEMLSSGFCRIMSLVDNNSFRKINCKGNFKERLFSNTRGELAEYLESNKVKMKNSHFSINRKIENKITFNNYDHVNFNQYNSRLDAIVIASLTNEYHDIVRKYAHHILIPGGHVFICDNSYALELKGMRCLKKGVYVRV